MGTSDESTWDFSGQARPGPRAGLESRVPSLAPVQDVGFFIPHRSSPPAPKLSMASVSCRAFSEGNSSWKGFSLRSIVLLVSQWAEC